MPAWERNIQINQHHTYPLSWCTDAPEEEWNLSKVPRAHVVGVKAWPWCRWLVTEAIGERFDVLREQIGLQQCCHSVSISSNGWLRNPTLGTYSDTKTPYPTGECSLQLSGWGSGLQRTRERCLEYMAAPAPHDPRASLPKGAGPHDDFITHV